MAIGSRATNPLVENANAPGCRRTRTYDDRGDAISLAGPRGGAGATGQGVAEEPDHATLVLLGVGLQPLDVLDVVHRPEAGAGPDQPLVERIHRLAVPAV